MKLSFLWSAILAFNVQVTCIYDASAVTFGTKNIYIY